MYEKKEMVQKIINVINTLSIIYMLLFTKSFYNCHLNYNL